MNDNERLRQIWEQRHELSQREFGKRFEIGTGSAVSHYLTGRSPLNLSVVVKFAKGLGCTVEEISPSLALLAKSAETLSNKVEEINSIALKQRLPILSDDYLLGHATIPENQLSEKNSIVSSLVLTEGAFAWILPDQSMAPEFLIGDLLLFESKETARPSCFVLAQHNNRVVFRKYTEQAIDNKIIINLKPLNPDYPMISNFSKGIEILGVLKELRRSFTMRKTNRGGYLIFKLSFYCESYFFFSFGAQHLSLNLLIPLIMAICCAEDSFSRISLRI